MRYIKFVVLAVLVIVVNVESSNVCELFPVKDRVNCTCDISGGKSELFYYCNGVNIKISEIKYTGKTIQISCEETITSTLVLPKLGVAHSFQKLILNNCLSTELPLRDILDRLEVGAIPHLSVEGGMDSLASGQLANLTDVIRLGLNYLGLTHIDPNVFGDDDSPDSSIKELAISHNSISQLDHRVFKKLILLEWLDLSHNQLTTLPDDLFLHNKALIRLYIEHNRLERFSSELLRNQRTLDILFLSDNQLTDLSGEWTGLDSLTDLYLSNNQLTSLGEGEESVFRHLHKLKYLKLGKNKLTRLYRDWTRSRLIRIELYENNFETFQMEYLTEVTHHMEIGLSFNHITKVNIVSGPIGVVNNTKESVVTVNLLNNPLICDCALLSLVKYIKGDPSLSLPGVRFEFDQFRFLECGAPPKLKYRLLRHLSIEELACPSST